MKDNKQYFYLVATKAAGSETYVVPNKIMLQIRDAIKYGRTLATKFKKEHDEEEAPEFTVKLYRQLIAHTGVMEFVKVLEPYTTESNELKVYKFISPDNSIRYGLGKTFKEALKSLDPMIELTGSKYKIQILDSKDYVITPNKKFFIIKDKCIKDIIKVCEFRSRSGKVYWITGLYYADHHLEEDRNLYSTKKEAEEDYKFLMNQFKI